MIYIYKRSQVRLITCHQKCRILINYTVNVVPYMSKNNNSKCLFKISIQMVQIQNLLLNNRFLIHIMMIICVRFKFIVKNPDQKHKASFNNIGCTVKIR